MDEALATQGMLKWEGLIDNERSEAIHAYVISETNSDFDIEFYESN